MAVQSNRRRRGIHSLALAAVACTAAAGNTFAPRIPSVPAHASVERIAQTRAESIYWRYCMDRSETMGSPDARQAAFAGFCRLLRGPQTGRD